MTMVLMTVMILSYLGTSALLCFHRYRLTALSQKREELISIYIVPDQSQTFKGYTLLQSLLSLGFRPSKTRRFAFNDNGMTITVVSATEPGYLDHSLMSEQVFYGICLFGIISYAEQTVVQFDRLVYKASQLANALGGRLLTKDKKPFDHHQIQLIHQRLFAMDIARKDTYD